MGKLNRAFPVAALLGLCGLIFFCRLHTYGEPLERDVTTYAVIAHQMLAGKVLYTELWDHKPPAVHVTYAAAELIAGYGRDSIFLMNVVATLTTLVACYFAGSGGGGDRMAGLVAATLWALASGDLAIEGNQPNIEVFLNAFLMAGFAILMRTERSKFKQRCAVLVGLFFAAASLYKQIVVVEVALVALAYFASAPKESRKQALVDLIIIATIGAAAWASVFGYFSAQGRGSAFIEAVFTYNRWYAGNIWQNLSNILTWPTVSRHVLAVALLMATFSIVGAVLALIFGPRRPWILLLAFILGTHIAVLLPGRFFPHYYQLWLPPLAVGTGWTLSLFRRILPMRLAPLSYAVAGIVCAILFILEAPYYALSAEEWSVRKYGNIFLKTDQLAQKIDNMLPRGATFYEWGNESELYFTSGRRPPSGIIYAYPMLTGPVATKVSQHLIVDLEREKPELIVIDRETLRQTRPGHPVLNWFKEHYTPFSSTDLFLLLARNGSKLDAQKKAAAN